MHCQPTTHVHRRPRHVAGSFRAEEGNHARDFFGRADAAQRRSLVELLGVRVDRRGERGVDARRRAERDGEEQTGGEGKGLRRLTRELCEQQVAIPMAGLVESLNVSVAAGVLLYEAVRQRAET